MSGGLPIVVENPRALESLVGVEVPASAWLPVTQERIAQFADATEDRQWIHVDPERAARESPYGATIAHGFLTMSLLAQFMEQAVHVRGGVRLVVNYGLNRVRFPSPVPVGSMVRARFTLQSCREVPGAVEAVWSVLVECAGTAKPCCVAEWVLRYYT